jgi:hypothetical protein
MSSVIILSRTLLAFFAAFISSSDERPLKFPDFIASETAV